MSATFARSGRYPKDVDICPICQEAIAPGDGVRVAVGGAIIAGRCIPEGLISVHDNVSRASCVREMREIVHYLRTEREAFDPNLLRRVKRAIARAKP